MEWRCSQLLSLLCVKGRFSSQLSWGCPNENVSVQTQDVLNSRAQFFQSHSCKASQVTTLEHRGNQREPVSTAVSQQAQPPEVFLSFTFHGYLVGALKSAHTVLYS